MEKQSRKGSAVNTAEIRVALREKYQPPEYAVLEEVRNQTGFSVGRQRTADMLVMGLWPSRGLHLHGIEIKSSRQDWAKELKDPGKAEEIARFCDYWWLAVGDKNIVKDGELPATWGLLAPRGNKMVVVKEAEKFEPQSISRPFLAAIMRKLHEGSATTQQIETAKKKAADEAVEKHVREHEKWHKYETEQNEKDRELIRRFNELTGIRLSSFNCEKVAVAVKTVYDGGLDFFEKRLAGINRELSELFQKSSSSLEGVRAVSGIKPEVDEERGAP